MSFLSNLQNSVSTTSIGGTAQFILSTGCANNNIETHSQNATISTKCGDQNIAVDVSNNLVINTGCCGSDMIVGRAGNAFINTNCDDDTIILDCDNLDLDVGCGNDNVIASATGSMFITGGCGDKAVLAENTGGNGSNTISFVDGNHTINAIGNNFSIITGNGNQEIGTLGNNYSVYTGNGNNKIGFYGSNISYTLGNGNHDVRTLDNWFSAGSFTNAFDGGLFDHSIGLANSFSIATAAYDKDNNLCYKIDGSSNVSLKTGNGSLQGLVTIGDGSFKLNAGESSAYRNIDISLGSSGSLQNFETGVFKAQNGYILWDTNQ